MQLEIKNPNADSLNDALGISEERAGIISNGIRNIIFAMNDNTKAVGSLVELVKICDNTEEIIYGMLCWQAALNSVGMGIEATIVK